MVENVTDTCNTEQQITDKFSSKCSPPTNVIINTVRQEKGQDNWMQRIPS